MVDVEALGLFVGSAFTVLVRSQIIVDAECPKALDDVIDRTGHLAVLVGVLNAEDECSARLPGYQPRKKGSPYAANMEEARWARSETRHNRFHIVSYCNRDNA